MELRIGISTFPDLVHFPGAGITFLVRHHLDDINYRKVTAQEELHIVPTDGSQCFYHDRRNNEVMLPLRNEFTRLSTVHLTIIDQIMMNKMNGGDMVLVSLNCQSLHAHARDLRGNTVQKAQILMLSESWLRNEKLVEIENFKGITHSIDDIL
ncbi:hypothetical protein TNCV_3888001 [Trichonephila clavipes]|nr:hypothetical protein TNCV_3888001 [Trichonephila clavipes]